MLHDKHLQLCVSSFLKQGGALWYNGTSAHVSCQVGFFVLM